MDYATLVGMDLGKHSFHLHGQDQSGKAVFRKKLGRKQLVEFFATHAACTVVMEACAGSHHMARKLATFGHEVKLISPQFVRPFVKSNKNDFRRCRGDLRSRIETGNEVRDDLPPSIGPMGF